MKCPTFRSKKMSSGPRPKRAKNDKTTDSSFSYSSFFARLDDPNSVPDSNLTAFADLRRELLSKDDLLTETRLEALAAASQLQTLRETVARLRQELKVIQD